MRARRCGGFTLVEMALVLVLLALTISGLVIPLARQVEMRRIADAQRQLDDARDALLGFAAINGRFPCPDANTGTGANDGLEDQTGAAGARTCAALSGSGASQVALGSLPWATLGIADADPWGNRLRYAVTPAFAQEAAAVGGLFQLTTTGNMRVCAQSGCAAGTVLAATLPAVILSHGPNGLGAVNTSGAANPSPVAADERDNADAALAPADFVWHPMTGGAVVFDDVVTWLPMPVIANRLIVAGRLP